MLAYPLQARQSSKSKIVSIRGKIEGVSDNSIVQPVNVFSYESPARNRAWRVIAAYLWPVTSRASVSADGQYLLEAGLMTDTYTISDFTQIMDPSENRNFAWLSAGYKTEDASTDFLAPQSLNQLPTFTIDPDTVITNDLYITMQTTSTTTSPAREWGYMVVLEQMKIKPMESILQQLKGIGQNDDS